jgi:ElaB/YqjD/DUF883 family membrane-anchored ribosome-binding protein
MMQTATNPQTGETAVLIDGAWAKADKIATNDAGEKAFLVGGKWLSDSPSAKPQERAPRTTGENVARQLGLTVRAGVTGALALPSMVGDALGMDTGGALNRLLTRIGVPQPESASERVAQDVAGAMAGGGGVSKLAQMAAPTSMVGQGVQQALVQGQGMQTAAAAASGGAAGVTREMGGGPAAQSIAGLVAGVGVPAAAQAARGFVPNMLAKSIQKSDATPFAQEGERLAKETGIDLTLGSRSGNKQVLGLENTARQYGPTADRVQEIDVKIANQAIDRVKSLADKITTSKIDPETLGSRIESTVKTAATRLDEMRSKVADRDYGRVRELAGDKPVIGLTNFQEELQKIIAQNENVVGADAQKVVSQAKAALEKVGSTLGNTVDEAMKARRFYGQAAKGAANVFDDVSPNMNRNLAARLFGAINRDFEQASSQVAPGLKNALDTANGNYKKFTQSLEYLEKSALGKLVGEDLADAALSGKSVSTTSGESIIKKINGLDPSTRKTSMEILNRWNPELTKQVKANFLRGALDEGMAIAPSEKGASQVPISFNKFLSALGSKKVYFEKNLESYGFSSKEISDIRDTAVAMMRAGDRTGYNYSNSSVQNQAMEVAGALGKSAGSAASGDVVGAAKGITGAGFSIAGKFFGLNKIADAMASEEGRKALRTIISSKASPQAIIESFAVIENNQ